MKIIHFNNSWSPSEKVIVNNVFKKPYCNFFVTTINELIHLQKQWTKSQCCCPCYIVASYLNTTSTSNIINNCALETKYIVGSTSNASFFQSFPKFKFGKSQTNNSVNIKTILNNLADNNLDLFLINSLDGSYYEIDLYGNMTLISFTDNIPIIQNSAIIINDKYIYVTSFSTLPPLLYNEKVILDEYAFYQLIEQEGENVFTYEIQPNDLIKITNANYIVSVHLSTLNVAGYEIDLMTPTGNLTRNTIQTYANLIYRSLTM
jgi:hypothetical protein